MKRENEKTGDRTPNVDLKETLDKLQESALDERGAASPNKNATTSTNYAGGSQTPNGHLPSLSIVSVRQPCDENGELIENAEHVTSKNAHSCYVRLEIVMKGVQAQNEKSGNSKETAEVDGDAKANESPVPPDQDQSEKSLRRSRGLWRAMGFPPDFEDAFKHNSDTDSNSDSESESESKSESESESESNSDSDDFSPNRPFYGPNTTETNDATPWAKLVVSELKPEDVDDNSPSRLEWLRQKRENNEENPYLDQLMSMIGMEEVKAHFLAIKAAVKRAKHNYADFQKLRLHLVLYGKDGTGKKSIAKLYAQFLFSIGAVYDNTFSRIQASRSTSSLPELSRFFPPHLFDSSTRFSHRPAKDCTVVFCDMSNGDSIRPDEIEKIMKIGSNAVLILSSRDKSLLDSIEGSEKALQELQAPITLSDFNNDELMQLLVRMIKKRSLSIHGGFKDDSLRILVNRAARERESEAFSNVHFLEKELDNACRRRALRLRHEHSEWLYRDSNEPSATSGLVKEYNNNQVRASDKHETANSVHNEQDFLTPEDILGPEPKDIKLDNSSWKKLQDMIGLENIKRECGDIIEHAQINYKRELLGMEPLKINLNRLFLGPPGVGKTTVAQLYGQILIDLGLVSGKKVMLKNPSHLIGAYIGHSEKMTKDVLEQARGNVLIIDDAHMLYPGAKTGCNKTDVFRVAVLDTLVANVSSDPEDRCIILAGYDHEMEQLFNNSNPGLQRRFPKETALRFKTYGEDELCQIMDLEVKKSGLKMMPEARTVSRQLLSRMRINPKFGNAGDVTSLLNQAKVRINARIRSIPADGFGSVQVVLEPGDIDPEWDRASRVDESRSALFKGFVGFNKIIEQFEGYQLLVAGMRLHDIDPKPHIPWAFIFKGPPGTGKTSTARKVGRLYYDLGLLSTDEVVTCSVSDIVGEYAGQTGPKVLNTLETGLGKVLFIDEAYRLASSNSSCSSFQQEAVGELVDAMTRPRYSNNMVIILAGYTDEMELLIRTNPGLRSRFPVHVAFPQMTPSACLQHLKNEVQKLNIQILDSKNLWDEKMKTIYRLFEKLSHTRGWASGRDVQTLAKSIIGRVYMRQGRVGKVHGLSSLHMSTEELIEVLRNMLQERQEHQINEVD